MSIKNKLLLTNIILFNVMAVLAVGYNVFVGIIAAKFPMLTINPSSITEVSAIMSSSGSYGDKADAARTLGYNLSVYDDSGQVVFYKGTALSGYTFTSGSVPKMVILSNKLVVEQKVGQFYYAAVMEGAEDSSYNYYNSVAIVLMLTLSGIAVCMACLYEFRTIFPALSDLRGALKQVSAGNYDCKLSTKSRDEIGSVMGEFEIMRKKLADLNRQKVAFDRQRGEIIAGISHDLKTPLTTIQGYTKGLLDGIAKTPEKTQRYLTTIYETAATMNSLVNQLSEFSKMDIDTIEYIFMERDLVQLIVDFVKINAPVYASKGLKINTIMPKEKIMADIDKEQFLRVVQNILDNSVKYKEKDVGNSIIKVYTKGGKAVIEVADDGPGVLNHEINYIFESYYRGDPSRTNPTTGSGLGLSIVKTVIAAHKGEVSAENDNGLRIIILLPQRRKRV